MDVLASLRRRFRYHTWATATLAEVVADAGDPLALRPLAHALTADRVWLLRLRGQPSEGVALWPDLDAEGCRSLARRNAEAYAELLASTDDPDATVTYETTDGVAHETAVGDVLDHVLFPAAHHRGQASAALRADGTAPPWVDFIAWVRQGEPAP